MNSNTSQDDDNLPTTSLNAPLSSFQFKLWHLLLLMVPVGVIAAIVADRIENRSIAWEPFSQARLDEHLDDGKTVFLFVVHDWDATGKVTEKYSLETLAVKRWLRKNKIVPMKAGNPRRMRLDGKDRIDLTGNSGIVVYPNGEELLAILEEIEIK